MKMFAVHCFNGEKKECRRDMEGAKERNKGDAGYETNYSPLNFSEFCKPQITPREHLLKEKSASEEPA
jgi:hypothetical protein